MKLLKDVTRSIPDLDRILFAVLMESEGVSAEFIALSNKVTTVREVIIYVIDRLMQLSIRFILIK